MSLLPAHDWDLRSFFSASLDGALLPSAFASSSSSSSLSVKVNGSLLPKSDRLRDAIFWA